MLPDPAHEIPSLGRAALPRLEVEQRPAAAGRRRAGKGVVVVAQVSRREPTIGTGAARQAGQSPAPTASWPPLRSELARCIGVDAVTQELACVEQLLRATTQAADSSFTEPAAHLVAAGGKRLRPLLTLAAAHTGRHVGTAAGTDRAITAALAVELLHLGTLCHDDVIDQAQTRRGLPSVNARWGNTVAVLAGDWLLATVWVTASSLGAEEAPPPFPNPGGHVPG